MPKQNLLQELKRRNVYKVALAYGVTSWLLSQIVGLAADTFEAPVWVMKMVIVILIIGFPIALILAWAFEMSPQGIIRTTSVASGENPYPDHKKKPLTSNAIIGVLLLVVIGQFVYNNYQNEQKHESFRGEKSVAVLPFMNESSNKENQYFCNGIMEGILDHLTKISELTVTSRSSVEQYRDNRPTAQEIADKLNVEYLVEGSVQRIGDQAVIFAQLISADDDKHLWSKRYEREISDIFTIQSEITQSIASELQAIVAPDVKKRIESVPTNDPRAYDYYLRGMYFYNDRFGGGEAFILSAIEMFENAVELDASFAKAHLSLAYCHDHLHWIHVDGSTDRADRARYHYQKALELDPTDPEIIEGQGWYEYHINNDYDKARDIFSGIVAEYPKLSTPLNALGVVNGRLGNWREAEENFEKSISLDPNYVSTNLNYYLNLAIQRKYIKAKTYLDKLLNISPQNKRAHIEMSKLIILVSGDVQGALKYFQNSRTEDDGHERHLKVLTRSYDQILQEGSKIGETEDMAELADLAMVSHYTNNNNLAESYAREAIRLGTDYITQSPSDYMAIAKIGLMHALIGDKPRAIELIQSATSSHSSDKDALLGPELELVSAKIFCALEEDDQCIDLLNKLFSIPAYLTTHLLQVDPAWDRIRDDVRFKELLKKQRQIESEMPIPSLPII